MYNFIIKVPREYSRTDHCVKSVQIQSYCWSVFSPNTEKYGPEITPRTARKTTFYFSRRPKKMVTPKKLRWNMIFLVLSGKMIFLFPVNMILPLRRKMKDDLSHKNTRKYDIFFKCSEKMAFLKSAALGHDLILPVKMVFFPRKHDIFSLGGKWEIIFLKKYMEIWCFLCTRTGVTNVAPRPSIKKNQRWSYPAKKHMNVIDVLEWHFRKWSSNSLYFHGDLTGIFMYCSPAKKKQETWYMGLKFGFFFNLFGWRYSTINNLQYFVPFSPQELRLEVCLSANQGNYLSSRRWVIISKI